MLKKPNIFLFDEATSNLDSFSEQIIHQLIFKTIKNKTTIIIAHRLSTIVNCDIIFFIDNGAFREQGSHEELMALNGHYASMIRIQRGNIDKISDEKRIEEGVEMIYA